jgi:hypothetical protein
VRSIQSLRTLVVAFVAAAFAAVALPAPAHAAAPDIWGFAYVDNPTVPLWTTLNPAYQATSPTIAPVQGGRTGTGRFLVRFAGLGVGPKGNVHVTAVSKKGYYCETVTWDQSGPDEVVDVACFAPGGTAVDAAFSVVWTLNYTLLPGLAASFASVQYVFTGVQQFYNSTGGGVTATPISTGVTDVRFEKVGDPSGLNTGNVQVTAQDFGAQPHWCKAGAVTQVASDVIVTVYCFDAHGRFLDTRFTASFARERPVVAATGGPAYFGHVWSPMPLPLSAAQTNFNNALGGYGGNVVFIGGIVGSVITVTFPKLAVAQTQAQVTAYGNDNLYCTLAKTWAARFADLEVTTQCYDPTGTPTPELAYIAATSDV